MIHFWIFYAIGQISHLIQKADHDISDPQNKISGWHQYFRVRGPTIQSTLVLCTAGFLFWLEKPDAMNGVLSHVGLALPNLPLTKATAIVYGYFSDSIVMSIAGKVQGMLSRGQSAPQT